jgi:hypothetical protein
MSTLPACEQQVKQVRYKQANQPAMDKSQGSGEYDNPE